MFYGGGCGRKTLEKGKRLQIMEKRIRPHLVLRSSFSYRSGQLIPAMNKNHRLTLEPDFG